MSTETIAENKILSRKQGPIGHLVFNNPEKRNAFSLEMSLAAADVMDDFLADEKIRVIVLSGAGDKAFVSGGDISKFEKVRASKEDVANYTKTGERFRTLLKGSAKPTIAMIRGYCLGGGMAIALNCDIRICTEDASFAFRQPSSASAMPPIAWGTWSIWWDRRLRRTFSSPAGACRRRRRCDSAS